MSALPLGLNAYQRTGLPEVRLENFFPENAPTSSTGAALLPFPGMAAYATRGTGSIRGLYQQDGVFSGDLFAVSGTALYRGASSLGTVAGSDDVEFAARTGRLYILGNGIVYDYDGTTLSAMAFPDSASVASICDLKGILYAARAGTGRIYYLLPGETAWQALDYQTAEAEEDPVLALRSNADEVWAFGSSSVQPFYPTGNVEQPLQSADGRSHSLGIRHRDTARCMDNAVLWVDEQGRVVRDGGVISNYGIAERIERSTSLRAFDFAWQGHEFYALEIGGEGTFLYDLSAGTWCERASYNATVWKGRCARQIGAVVLIGGSSGGAVYQLDADQLTDAGEAIVRVFTCAVPVQGAGRVANLMLNCSVGNAASEPQIGVRWSDDQGRTFSEWRYASLGDTGEYRTRVVWRALGMMDFPGRVYEFRCSDQVALRLSGADYNVPMGGRSR
jgi:hypothetical protein